MDTAIFGPIVWRLLEDVSHQWDVDSRIKPHTQSEKQTMIRFFNSLRYVLPCIHCRTHLAGHLQDNPFLPFLEQGKLLRWVYELHETVNIQTAKPTYNDIVQMNYASATGERVPLFGFAMLVKKLEVYSSGCTMPHILDLLYIICENLHISPQDMAPEEKYAWHVTFLNCLPTILEPVAALRPLATAWKAYVIDKHIVMEDVVIFLNGLSKKHLSLAECDSIASTLAKYKRATAEYLPDTTPWYGS
jgi:hypothetical protein